MPAQTPTLQPNTHTQAHALTHLYVFRYIHTQALRKYAHTKKQARTPLVA